MCYHCFLDLFVYAYVFVHALAPRDVSVTNATTDGFMVHWRAPAVGVGPMDGFLVQASRQDTKQVVESVSLAVGDRDYQFICLQPNSTFTGEQFHTTTKIMLWMK